MNYEHLLMSSDGAIATITLNRPEKRNALALPVMLELTHALQDVARSDALGLILAANGPVFCAGHNFGDMLGTSEHKFVVPVGKSFFKHKGKDRLFLIKFI